MIKKILVTGATGTTGSELVRQLSVAGAQIRVLVRSEEKKQQFSDLNIEFALGDFNQPDTLKAAFEGITCTYMLPPTGEFSWQKQFVEIAKSSGVKHIVKLSVLEAEKVSPKHDAGDKILIESGVGYTILRPSFFMQSLYNYPIFSNGKSDLYFHVKEARISMIDVRDIATVAVKALTEEGHEGKIYDISGSEAFSFYEVAERLSATLGKKVTYVASPEKFKQNAMEIGMPETMVDEMMISIAKSSAKVTPTVRKLIGRDPISFDQFARDQFSILQKTIIG